MVSPIMIFSIFWSININFEAHYNFCSPGLDLHHIRYILKTFKGEIQNRFNLNSEGRVKNFKQNSENLMKISWKIRKLWYFEVLQMFTKHFWKHRYEYIYANEWGADVIASLLAIYFVYNILEIFILCPTLW